MIDIDALTDEEIEEKISKCHQTLGPAIDRGVTSLVVSIENLLERLSLEQEIRSQQKQHDMLVHEHERNHTTINAPLDIGVMEQHKDE